MRPAPFLLLVLLHCMAAPASAGIDPVWRENASAALEAREYHFSADPGGGVTAPNRAQNLRTRITPSGFTMTSRTQGAPGFEVTMRLSGFGRGGAAGPVGEGEVGVDAGRATLARPGAPLEWWINDERGLEHGFTVEQRPAGADGDVVLAMQLELGAGLETRLHPDGRTLAFARPGQAPRLRYSNLIVRDADGDRLDAWFALEGDAFEIRYRDAGARYPVDVDPLATTEWWSVEGTGGGDHLGRSVHTAGDVNGDGYSDIVVGIPREDEPAGDAGAVWVYYGSAAGLPSPYDPSWIGRNGLFGANFGHSSAPAGDVNGDGFDDLIVGQPFDILSGQRAFVYLGSANGLRTSFNNTNSAGDWKASGDGAFTTVNRFGWSVGRAGDVNADGFDDVIVGAPYFSPSAAAGDKNKGAFYMWLGRANFGDPALGTSDDGTAANETFSYFGGGAGQEVGWAVAGVGDVNRDGLDDVLVGAPGTGGYAGNVQLLTGQVAAPHMGFADVLNGPAGSAFGHSVAPAGDVNGDGTSDVLIGAPGYDNGRGAVYLYTGRTTPPFLQFNRLFTGTSTGDSLGRSVHTAGDVNGDGYADVLLGAGRYQFNGTNPGYAQVYFGGPLGPGGAPDWTVIGPVFNTVNQSSAYGASVASAGDVDGDGFGEFIIGSPSYGQAEWGRAYVYRGSTKLPSTGTLGALGVTVQDVVGWGVSIAQDTNGDGYDDVLVGAPGWDGGLADQGALFCYHGGPNGTTVSPAWTRLGDIAGANLGVSVCGAGDVNGDRIGDVLAGAHTRSGVGAAFAWHGVSGGLPSAAPNWTVTGTLANGYFGGSVARAGDVNGDGYQDAIVGANGENGNTGHAYAYLGSASGLGTTPVWDYSGGMPNDNFGFQVGTAGDVNGDGLDDVVTGAHGLDANGNDRGRVYLFHGIAGSQGVADQPMWTRDGPSAGSAFGQSVGSAGDLNGDGYSDILAGAPGHGNMGRVEVHYGGPDGPDQTTDWWVDGTQAFSGYGASVATPGDVNADGYSDVMIGAVFWDGAGGQDCGRVFLHYGGPAGASATADFSTDGGASFANLGHFVAGGGDVNDDGFPDMVMGEPGYSVGVFRRGRAQLWLGNGLGRRRGVTMTAPCPMFCIVTEYAPQGRAGVSGFTPTMAVMSAAGDDELRGVTEVKPRRQPFDGTGLLTTGIYDTRFAYFGVFGQNATCPDDPCHWRMRVKSDNPFFPRSPWFSLPHNGPTESDVRDGLPVLAVDPAARPGALQLGAPWPNPTRGAARLDYALPVPGMVRLVVRDVAGRRVRVLASHWQSAGRHEALWDGRDESGVACAPGMYVVELSGPHGKATARLSLVR